MQTSCMVTTLQTMNNSNIPKYTKRYQKVPKGTKILQMAPFRPQTHLETATMFGGNTSTILLIVGIRLVQKNVCINWKPRFLMKCVFKMCHL